MYLNRQPFLKNIFKRLKEFFSVLQKRFAIEQNNRIAEFREKSLRFNINNYYKI